MRNIKLPYHKKMIDFHVDEKYVNAVLTSKAHEFKPGKSQTELINEALDNPIDAPPLEELIADKKNMVIITSDHTRPVPSKITLPIILKRVREVNPHIDIKIAVASGFHREITKEEMIDKFGHPIAENETFVIHKSHERQNMVLLDVLETGLAAEVNKVILDTDFLMAEGFIEPHFFAGFSGGRKSVFPGMASAQCIMANHCAEYINSPFARTGILENNPVHEEALAMARLAKLQFILNVVIDADKNIIKAFAGHYNNAHIAGCNFVRELAELPAVYSDIVITTNGGYPLDQNIYQSVKGMTAAEASCNKGGVIIMVSACNDTHGGRDFYETFKNAKNVRDVTEQALKRERLQTIPDQWESQILARILEKHRVIMVTDLCDKNIITDMHMDCVETVEQALTLARRYTSEDAKITVIPDGVSVIIRS